MIENPQDPLLQKAAAPDAQLVLFRRLVDACNGMPNDLVISAAANIIVNVLRQTYPNGAKAAAVYDEIMARTKSVLMDHYDMLGRKRGVFPFDQHINVPFNDFRHDPKPR